MTDPAPGAPNRWRILTAVCIGGFMAAMDTSIVNVILPVLVRVLKTDFVKIQWVSMVYLMTVTVLILAFGRLGDMIGKKPVYLTGFGIFLVGSLLCALAPGVEWLIAFRALQGIGAAMIMALGFAIATAAFPPNERGRAMGIIGGATSVSIVLGPVLGGLITAWASWHWIFLINLPIGLIGIFMVVRQLPAPTPRPSTDFDLTGAALLFLALTALLTGLSAGQSLGFSAPLPMGLFTAAVIGSLAFIIRQLMAATPLVDLRLFQEAAFRSGLINSFVTFFASAGTMVLIAFYLQNALGYGIREAGLLMAVVPLFMGGVSPLAGRLADRFTPWPILLLGQILLVFAYAALSRLGAAAHPVDLICRFALLGTGMGLFMSPNHTAIMADVPKARLGIASGLMTLSRTLGQVIGVAALGTFWTLFTRNHAPAGLRVDVTAAPAAARAAGFADTLVLVTVLVFIALISSAWAFRRIRRAPAQTHPALPGKETPA